MFFTRKHNPKPRPGTLEANNDTHNNLGLETDRGGGVKDSLIVENCISVKDSVCREDRISGKNSISGEDSVSVENY